jgi:hypothetical protein
MCFDIDGYAEFAAERVSVARKPHRCDECRAEIAPGEAYRCCSGKFDGHFFTHKVCRRCEYDLVRVVEHELAEGCRWGESWPPLGGLVEHLDESGMGQTQPGDVPASFRVGDEPRRPAAAGATNGG